MNERVLVRVPVEAVVSDHRGCGIAFDHENWIAEHVGSFALVVAVAVVVVAVNIGCRRRRAVAMAFVAGVFVFSVQ